MRCVWSDWIITDDHDGMFMKQLSLSEGPVLSRQQMLLGIRL